MKSKEKNSFLLGLLIGIAIVSFLGFVVMGVKVLGNTSSGLSNAKTVDDSVGKVAEAPAVEKAPTQPSNPSAPIDIVVATQDHIRGSEDAPVTIVEFSDAQCPFCSRFHSTMQQVMSAYPTQVRWIYKHFPLSSIHSYAKKAAQAQECAGEQDKFWEYTDALFENQSSINNDYFPVLAKKLNLNTSKFNSCLESEKYKSKVDSDFAQGQQAGVRGTPGNFVNGISIPGAVPFDQIKSVIDSQLN